MTARKIAIVGTHSATKRQAPYGDPSWEIWSFSPGNENDLPRADVWFELHDLGAWQPQEEYRQWLREQPLVYMQRRDPEEFPGSAVFPKPAIEAEFGSQFLNCSAALIIAFALQQQPDAIGIWGIEGRDARGHQRSSLQHFLLLARDRGINVVTPTSLLNSEPVYGYDFGGIDELAEARKRIA